MNVSKFLISSAAAATVVSAIGFAYAQNTASSISGVTTTGTTAQTTQSDATLPNQPAPFAANTQEPQRNTVRGNMNRDGNMNNNTSTVSTDTDMSTERAARADRN